MVDAKKELRQIAKSLAVLTRKTEKLAKQVQKMEKAKTPKRLSISWYHRIMVAIRDRWG